MRTTTWLLLCGALALTACNNTSTTGDAGSTTDSPTVLTCPMAAPNPDEQMLPCCYRVSQADRLDAPEMRLRYIDITSPASPSPIEGTAVGSVLNTALTEETFNWLFRTTGADGDGDITIETGFGRRNTDGTYSFSTGAAGTEGDPDTWLPVTIPATITGDVITSGPITAPLTVPIFDEAMTTVQIELILHSVQIVEATLTEERSCIGVYRGRSFDTAATLAGFIRVDEARAGIIMLSGINASLCGVVAGSISSATYCEDTAQGEWRVPPDSICDDTGVCHVSGEGGATCDPATTCNAWRLEAAFAAHGIEISP